MLLFVVPEVKGGGTPNTKVTRPIPTSPPHRLRVVVGGLSEKTELDLYYRHPLRPCSSRVTEPVLRLRRRVGTSEVARTPVSHKGDASTYRSLP